jgi:prepilin-type N-terminal cleavage/methylation domain-containing protein
MKRRNTKPSKRRFATRGFSLIELLIALAITGALLTATMVSLNASFMAYQTTTEVASTHTIGRLTMHRMLSLIRTGQDFGPFPTNPLETTVRSDFMEFVTPEGEVMALQWVQDGQGLLENNALYVVLSPGTAQEQAHLLLEGVMPQYDGDGDLVLPFTLEFERGRNLYRATIDMTISPDDNMSVMLDGANEQVIRLVASAMPRMSAF